MIPQLFEEPWVMGVIFTERQVTRNNVARRRRPLCTGNPDR